MLLARLGEMCRIESIVCDLAGLPALADLDPEASYLSWEVVLRSNKGRAQLLDQLRERQMTHPPTSDGIDKYRFCA